MNKEQRRCNLKSQSILLYLHTVCMVAHTRHWYYSLQKLIEDSTILQFIAFKHSTTISLNK